MCATTPSTSPKQHFIRPRGTLPVDPFNMKR
jgi:hypothetical protein